MFQKQPSSKSKNSRASRRGRKNKDRIWIAVGIIALLIGNAAFFFWNQYRGDDGQLTAEIAETPNTNTAPTTVANESESLDDLFATEDEVPAQDKSAVKKAPPSLLNKTRSDKSKSARMVVPSPGSDLTAVLETTMEKTTLEEPSPETVSVSAPEASPVVAGQFDRGQVMSDYQNRINDQFAIPAGLQERVGFWFDVYTKYDDNRRIIHNSRYPWIIYKVVDVTDIINAPTPRRRWMRNMKADQLVDAEAKKIRAALKTVAKRSHLRNLTPAEQSVVKALQKLGGSAQKQARLADGFTRIQVGQKSFFEEGLRMSPRYLPEMERIFAARKLPIELSRLPFVESSFNKHATSKVGASGIWQFMGNTGRKFMLVNDYIDERRSPFKATDAAARLLKENHLILYRSWPLALTAYNHGPGGVRKAVKATNTKDLAKIIRTYQTKSFNFASSNFYCEFLAALHAQMYKDVIWGPLQTEKTIETHVVRLPRSYRPSHLMKLTGINADQFLLHNPDLGKAIKGDLVIPSGFRFHVPHAIRGKVERILAQTDGNERRTRRKG